MMNSLTLTLILVIVGINVACGKNDSLKTLDEGSLAVPPETMSVLIKGYKAQNGATFQHLFASNFSVKAERGRLIPSSARDGMGDTLKATLAPIYGFTGISPESVVKGFADILLFDLGVLANQQTQLHCASAQQLSSSNDALIYNDRRPGGNSATFLGLRDCEKLYMGLNPAKFDNAGNGIPDYMKLRCGLSPTNENVAYVSTAGDGVSNIDKCKRNIPIDENANTQPNQLFAYKYTTQQNSDGTTDFLISNIPILNGGVENFLAFYVTETGLSGNAPGIFTAYAVLKSSFVGKKLDVTYWATDSSRFTNQEILVP